MAKGRARSKVTKSEARPSVVRDRWGRYARPGAKVAAPAAAPRDRWGRYARPGAKVAAPAAAPRDRFGRFRGKAPVHVAPIMGRDARGRFTGPLPLSSVRYKLRDTKSALNTKTVPRAWKSGARKFTGGIDRTSNRHRTVVAVVEGYFMEESPKGTGGSEDEPVVRHFHVGVMSGLDALALTEDDVAASIERTMRDDAPFTVLRVLAILERQAPTLGREG